MYYLSRGFIIILIFKYIVIIIEIVLRYCNHDKQNNRSNRYKHVVINIY